jgi:hypothetical protein
MLAIRVWALWKGSHIILTIYFLVLSGNVLNFLGIYGLSLIRGTILLYSPPYTGCIVIPNSNVMWITFTNTLVFEAFSISLIVYKSWPLARLRRVETPLFSMLLEDGIAYYLCFSASKLFIVVCVYVPSVVATVTLPAFISVSVGSLAVNRLFLRLQRTMLNKTSSLMEYTNTRISIARHHTDGDGGGDDGITTSGGSGMAVRRVHSRRRSHIGDELFSLGEGDVEMSLTKKGELHATDLTHHSSTILPASTASGSSNNVVVPVLDSKPYDAV